MARDGFPVTIDLARSLEGVLDRMAPYPASVAQFSKAGVPYGPGEVLRQPDLARTLERIATQGAKGFYEGETARLIEAEMKARGGLITTADLGAYRARRVPPLRGEYRGHEVLSMPPISSGGVALIEMLNILEGYDLAKNGYGSAENVHLIAEAMRRAFADRAAHLGDPAFNPHMPIDRLISKPYAAELRKTIDRRPRITIDADEFHLAVREHRDDSFLSRGCRTQRRRADLHARVRIRIGDRRARCGLSPQQRDGGLQRGAGSHDA